MMKHYGENSHFVDVKHQHVGEKVKVFDGICVFWQQFGSLLTYPV
jgi:hypothetical protein